MSSNEKYNGWTNYPTWRVHLEMFDGLSFEDLFGESYRNADRYARGQAMEEYAEDYIEATTSEGLARDWAMAFISDVNWYEIADHVLPDNTNKEVDK